MLLLVVADVGRVSERSGAGLTFLDQVDDLGRSASALSGERDERQASGRYRVGEKSEAARKQRIGWVYSDDDENTLRRQRLSALRVAPYAEGTEGVLARQSRFLAPSSLRRYRTLCG